MAVVAPSSSSRAGQQVDPMLQQQQQHANFIRQLQGLGDLEGAELDRFGRRQEAQQFRQDQLAGVEESLGERQILADETERTLREAGLQDVAERFRNASRRSAQNMARRGLQGGSADIQMQAEQEAAAGQEAEGVARQAAQARIGEQLANARQAAVLQQALQQQDPLEAVLQGQELSGVQDDAQMQALLGQYSSLLRNGQNLQRGALGAGIGQGLSSFGASAAAGLIGSA